MMHLIAKEIPARKVISANGRVALNRMASTYCFTLESVNPNIRNLQFGVYGDLVTRALKYEQDLDQSHTLPFNKLVYANVGDGQAMGQQPITWIRQVLATATLPSLLLNQPQIPDDVKTRVVALLESCAGNTTGAYAVASGIPLVRRNVAHFLSSRDGPAAPCSPDDVILTTGATEAIKAILSLLNDTTAGSSQSTGVMIPIPQYPVYSSTLCEYGMTAVPYFLNESKNWQIDEQELSHSLARFSKTVAVKAIVVINPNNPTGSVLSRKNLEAMIKFAADNKLVIIADEVYMHNIYNEVEFPFVSIRKVMGDMGIESEVFSLMSASKGYMGECGTRGGFVQMSHFRPQVKAELHKLLSAGLGGPVLGQLAMDCIVNPPQVGQQSYHVFKSEKDAILSELGAKARLASEMFNSTPGMSCSPVNGSIYAFPKIELPAKILELAAAQRVEPDFYYLMKLLEATGICLTPGSSFGQAAGTHHFRATISPPLEQFKHMCESIQHFHVKFMEQNS